MGTMIPFLNDLEERIVALENQLKVSDPRLELISQLEKTVTRLSAKKTPTPSATIPTAKKQRKASSK